MKLEKKYYPLILIAPLVILLDQATKYFIVEHFSLGETSSIISGFFSFTYIRNTGAAFGLLARAPAAFRVPFFFIVPGVALLAIGYIFRKIGEQDLRMSSALSLVIGGAVGNLIDRLRFEYVVDFLDFHWRYQYHFPAFNIADSAICVGVGLLMLDFISQKDGGDINAPTST